MSFAVNKRVLIKLIITISLLAGGWWLAVSYLNQQYLTSALTERVRQEARGQLGRPVELSELKLNMRGGIEVHNLRIGKLPGERQDMLRAKKLVVGINLWQALRFRDFVGTISQIKLVSAELWLGQGEDGEWNFAQFMEPGGEPAEQAAFHGKLAVADSTIIIAAQGRPQEKIKLSQGQVSFAHLPQLEIKIAGLWEEFPLELQGTYDLERKLSDLRGKTGKVSIVSLLDAIAQRGFDLSWGKINAGEARLDFRIWDSQLATAINLFGGKVQFMIGGKIQEGHWQPPGWQQPVKRLAGKFRWDTSSKELVLQGVTAELNQAIAQGEGTITFGASPLYDVAVRAQGRVSEVFKIYPDWKPRGLEADGWAKAKFAFAGTGGALRITGSAEIDDGRVYHPALGTPVEGIRGTVAMEPNKITLNQLACNWQGGSFTVEDGSITSPWSVPRGRAAVTMHSLNLPGTGGQLIQSAQANVRFQNKKIWFDDVTAAALGGKLAGFVLLDFEGPQPLWQSKLSVWELDLANLGGIFQSAAVPSLAGKASGEIVARGEGFQTDKIDASAQLALGPTAVGQLAFSEAEANVLWDGEQLQLGYLTLTQAGGTLSAAGRLDPNSLQLSVTGKQLPLGIWTKLALPQEEIDGKINLVGQIRGTVQDPNLIAQVELVDGRVRGQKIQQAHGKLSFEGNTLSTPEFTVRSQGAIHKLSGSLATGDAKQLDLKWQLQEEKLERIMELAGLTQPIAGKVAGQIQLTGTLPKITAVGNVNVLEGRVAQQSFSRGSFSFQSQGDVIVLERAILEQNGSRLAARGTISGDGALNMMIIAPELNLAALTFIPQEQLELLNGKVSFQGLVGGTLSAPTVVGELTSQRLQYGKYLFEDLAGSINFEDNILELTAFKLQWLGSQLLASGQLLWGEDPRMDLQVQVTGVPLGETVAFAGWEDGKRSLSGHLDGMIQITGPLKSPTGDGFFSLKGAKVGKLPVAGKGEVVLSEGSVQLRSVSLSQGRGTLLAKGLVTTSGLSLQVEGERLNLALISELLGDKIPPLSGNFSLNAEIMGDYAGPKIIAQVNTGDAKLGELKLGQVDAQFQLEDGIVQITKLQAQQNGGSLSVTGILPLSNKEAKAVGFAQAAKAGVQTDLDLTLEQVDLRLLAALNPNLQTLSGLVSAQLKLLGDANQPQLHGHVRINNGSYQHSMLGGKLERVNAALLFYGNQLVVEELDGILGGGRINISGGVELEGIKPRSYDLALRADGVRYQDQKMLDALLDGRIKLTGSAALPKLSGSVEVSKARVEWVPTTGSGKMPFDLLFDVDVSTKEQALFKYTNLVDIWFQGQVHVGGTLSNLALSGQVESKRGSFDYFEMSFVIDEARAEFFDYRGIMPTVQVNASSRVEKYTIQLNLTGPLENLDFKLSSLPELSQEEILALLGVTGRIDKILGTATGESSFEYLMRDELLRFLDTQFKSQFVSGVERTLEEILGLDEFRLEPNFFAKGEKMEIRLGKQLSERAFLSYERTLELRPKETFKLDWRLHPSLELKGQWNQETGSSLSLEAKFRF